MLVEGLSSEANKKLVSIFGKQTHITTSGNVTGLALLFDVMLPCLIRKSVRLLYIYVYLLWTLREMTPVLVQGCAMRRLDL